MSDVKKRIAELGLEIPKPVAPVANYVPFVISGGELFISGQVSIGPKGLIKGKLGADMSVEDGIAAAKACAVNLIAQMNAALDGDLDRVKRVVKLTGFVNCAPDFTDQPKVINGASDLMVAIFGDKGRHARAAVGAPSLPLGAAVEVDAIVEIA
ncbi:MAG TPA: RidA family protein [Parvularculaceae bacterium]|nr:RidA family protein [Parvularculaceae bacterium]